MLLTTTCLFIHAQDASILDAARNVLQQEGVLFPDVDRAPLHGPFASSPGLALIDGSLLSPIPGLLPFPGPGVVKTPPEVTLAELEIVPLLTPDTLFPAPTPCANAVLLKAVAITNPIVVTFTIHSYLIAAEEEVNYRR
jgi:hypothetical protein